MLFGRFICASILHLSLIDEVSNGLNFMKYSLNHPYKFKSVALAWSAGFLQFTSCLSVEISNIGVICTSIDPTELVFNFIALAIVAEFDNFIFESLKGETMKELVEKKFYKRLLVINHTTSPKRKDEELSTEKDENGDFRPLKLRFDARKPVNKLLFCIYKLVRAFYVSMFYYFLPFSAVILSTLLPIGSRFYIPPTCTNTK